MGCRQPIEGVQQRADAGAAPVDFRGMDEQRKYLHVDATVAEPGKIRMSDWRPSGNITLASLHVKHEIVMEVHHDGILVETRGSGDSWSSTHPRG
jgi:hypothetical protein